MFKSDDESQKFLTDTEVTSKMTSAKRLRDVDPSEYVDFCFLDGYFYTYGLIGTTRCSMLVGMSIVKFDKQANLI